MLEHVSQDLFDRQIEVLYKSLRHGGVCVFQVAPLFYAPFGSHLFGMHTPWEHLTSQESLLREQIYRAQRPQEAIGAWNCFLTLNRFTDAELIRRLKKAKLNVLNVYETYVKDVPSVGLLEVFNRDVLTKEQILVVCRKD